MRRNKLKISAFVLGTALAVAVSAPASAAVFTPTANPAEFSVTPIGGTIFTAPTITGKITRSGIAAGVDILDSFQFIIPQNGVGSGSLTTSTSVLGNATDVDIKSVTFNGAALTINQLGGGLVEFAGITGTPIVAGALNTIDIVYTSRGNGSFGGQLTFIANQAAVPEPGTWAMFIAGFGAVGFALRRKRQAVRVSYSA